jgi:hypothetical protein
MATRIATIRGRVSARWSSVAIANPDAALAELARGLDVLGRNFGDRFAAVLVPPWNHIADAIVARLPDVGLRGCPRWATSGPKPGRGIVQCNTHVDVIAWRRERAFIGVEARSIVSLRTCARAATAAWIPTSQPAF